ncbi:MAG: NAD+ synthase [Gammaproteobacteria bacterium]
MKISLVQENPVVGDIDGNASMAKDYILESESSDSELIVFSELFITGYPPEDLLLREDFLISAKESVENLSSFIKKSKVLIGLPTMDEGKRYNSAALIDQSGIIQIYNKHVLPNYIEFDEKRYFSNGNSKNYFRIDDIKIGISICEDIWDEGFIELQKENNLDLLVNLSASPFTISKKKERGHVFTKVSEKLNIPLIYVNQIGGQDELVFDGSSTVVDKKGDVTFELKSFATDSIQFRYEEIDKSSNKEKKIDRLKDLYDSLVLATKDYVEKNNFKGVLIGSSGGIDSALTATIATDALGSDKVRTIMMPFKYTADISINDAALLAKNLKINHQEIPIEMVYDAHMSKLSEVFNNKKIDKTEENLQSRIRGVTLMAISNKDGLLVLTTGNKSETAVGYSTLYGDTAGGFAVLKDVSKTLVYELSKYRNGLNEVIPERIIIRPPSAELAPDQKDSDSLPDYEILDPIIELYVEKDFSVKEIIQEGFDKKTVEKIIGLIDFNEYKRRQAPLGVKISDRNFDKGRRYPITNSWKPNI